MSGEKLIMFFEILLGCRKAALENMGSLIPFKISTRKSVKGATPYSCVAALVGGQSSKLNCWGIKSLVLGGQVPEG